MFYGYVKMSCTAKLYKGQNLFSRSLFHKYAPFSLDGNEYIQLLPMRKMKSPYSYAITKHSTKQKTGKIIDKCCLNIWQENNSWLEFVGIFEAKTTKCNSTKYLLRIFELDTETYVTTENILVDNNINQRCEERKPRSIETSFSLFSPANSFL